MLFFALFLRLFILFADDDVPGKRVDAQRARLDELRQRILLRLVGGCGGAALHLVGKREEQEYEDDDADGQCCRASHERAVGLGGPMCSLFHAAKVRLFGGLS